MVRRGQSFIPIFGEKSDVDGDGDLDGADNSEDFFMGVSSANPPTECCNFVESNSDGGCDDDPIDKDPETPDGGDPDRWLYRVYPGGFCAIECDGQNEDYWDEAVGRGYDFVATNCIDEDFTFDPATHSPMPLYVNLVPLGPQWGTLLFPYAGAAGLVDAFDRVSPMIEVRIQAGTYDITDGTVVDRPMVLKSAGSGTVIVK